MKNHSDKGRLIVAYAILISDKKISDKLKNDALDCFLAYIGDLSILKKKT